MIYDRDYPLGLQRLMKKRLADGAATHGWSQMLYCVNGVDMFEICILITLGYILLLGEAHCNRKLNTGTWNKMVSVSIKSHFRGTPYSHFELKVDSQQTCTHHLCRYVPVKGRLDHMYCNNFVKKTWNTSWTRADKTQAEPRGTVLQSRQVRYVVRIVALNYHVERGMKNNSAEGNKCVRGLRNVCNTCNVQSFVHRITANCPSVIFWSRVVVDAACGFCLQATTESWSCIWMDAHTNTSC